jgi:hypothetical protein
MGGSGPNTVGGDADPEQVRPVMGQKQQRMVIWEELNVDGIFSIEIKHEQGKNGVSKRVGIGLPMPP